MLDPNFPLTTEINTKGYMQVGGCDLTELKQEFGTPLYVLDEETLRYSCRQYMESFMSYEGGAEVIYASKALSVVGVSQIIKEEGFGFDVVSGGELFTVLKTGVDPQKIYFHGNNKSVDEMNEGLAAGIGYFVVDNFDELTVLDELAEAKGIKQKILVRITPGVEAHTHDYIQTGKLDSKFGINADEFVDKFAEVQSKKNLDFKGVHVHIGSQILKLKPFSMAIEIVADVLIALKNKYKQEVEVLDLGGGLGISYMPKDNPPAVKAYAKMIVDTIKYKFSTDKLKLPKIVVEPGRSVVGRAGITIYSVGNIKDLKGIRKYVAVDGGMGDNIRPAMYNAEYDAVIANKVDQRKTDVVTVAGKFCESGDILLKDILIQPPEKHDVLAILGTGAYNYSMSSNYNNFRRPAMVLVKEGKAKVLVERESYEDLLRKQQF